MHAHKSLTHTHHGIYIGEPDCDVIHFSGDEKGTLDLKLGPHCQIRKTTLYEFCDGETLRVCLVSYNCSKATKFSSLFHSASCHVEKAMPLSETKEMAIHFLNHPKEWGTYEEWKKYDFGSEPSEVFACFCKTGLLKIAAQLQPSRWVRIFRNTPCDTYREALESYRKMKRET